MRRPQVLEAVATSHGVSFLGDTHNIHVHNLCNHVIHVGTKLDVQVDYHTTWEVYIHDL